MDAIETGRDRQGRGMTGQAPILITGGLGFYGRFHAERLAGLGRSTVLVDIATDPSFRPPGARVVQADVRDREAMTSLLRETGPEAVIHAAAQLPLADEEEIRSTTVGGTRVTLEAARRAGTKRFVFLSSTAVYPPGNGVDRREDAPVTGMGTYGAAKVEAERLCAAARGQGMLVTVVRPKSFIGPGRMGIFQLLFEWIEEGRRVPMIGDGSNRYQLLDVEDLAMAIEQILESPSSLVDNTFNVGALDFGTVREDLENLCARAATGARPIGTPLRLITTGLALLHRLRLAPIYPWVYRTAGHDSIVPVVRLLELGWKPRHSNVEALVRAYESYRNRPVDAGANVPGTGHLAPWKAGAVGLVKHLF